MSEEYNEAADMRGCYEVATVALRERYLAENPPYKRKEIIGDCTLYLGDCREILGNLSNGIYIHT